MDTLPIILKKGKTFVEDLGCLTASQRSICPREKLVGYINASNHLVVQLLSGGVQISQVHVDDVQFIG